MPPDPMQQALTGQVGEGFQPYAPQQPPTPIESTLMGESPPAPQSPQIPQMKKWSGGMTALSMLGAGLTGWSDAKLGTNRSADYLKMLRGLKTDRQQAHLSDLLTFRQKIMRGDEEGALNTLKEKRLALGDEGTANGDSARQIMSFEDDPEGTLQEVDDIIVPLASRLGVTLPKSMTDVVEWKSQGQPVVKDGKMYLLQSNKAGDLRWKPTGRDVPVDAAVKAANQKQVDLFRKNISDVSKDQRKINASYRRLEGGLGRNTAAGDMSGIFNFMKINDPGSTVREGEYATAQNAGGWTDTARNYYNAALDGTRLTAKQRKDFLETAKVLRDGNRQATDVEIASILQQADQDNISRVKVMGKDRLSAFDKRQATYLEKKSLETMSDEELNALVERG